jgi:hypothetical protein
MKHFFLLLLGLFLTAAATAQAPNKISFQAVLFDIDNNLFKNKSLGVKVSLLSGSPTGAAVYVETHTPTTNLNGLMTFEIGGGTVVSGNFAAIDWSAAPFYVKTETDPAGGSNYTIVGTSQLQSVPYSLFANTANTANTATTALSANTANTATTALSANTALVANNGLPTTGNTPGDMLFWNGSA